MGFQTTWLPDPNRTGQPASKGPAWRSSGVYSGAAEAAVRSRWGRGDVHALAADLRIRKAWAKARPQGGERITVRRTRTQCSRKAGRCILALAADPANSTPGRCVGVC
jgi:hypothetical protein